MAVKGHATIELTDVNTGEKQVIEHDNVVTNGILKLVNYRGLGMAPMMSSECRPMPSDPIITNYFRGLFLFDKPLNDNPDDYDIPSDVSCVGYGHIVSNNSKNKMLGTFNTNECKYDATKRTATYVWDFSTDQANGTISSLALVSQDLAKMGWENKREEWTKDHYMEKSYVTHTMSISNANFDVILYYDEQYIYGIQRYNLVYHANYADRHIYNTKKLKIVRQLFSFTGNKLSLFSYPNIWNNVWYETVAEVELTDALKTKVEQLELNSTNRRYVVDYCDGYIYFCTTGGTVSAGNKFHFMKISIEDFSVTPYELTNTTGESIAISEICSSTTYAANSPYHSRMGIRVVKGKLVIANVDYDKLWIMDINDSTKIKQVKFSDDTTNFNGFDLSMVHGPYLTVCFVRSSFDSVLCQSCIINVDKANAWFAYTSGHVDSVTPAYFSNYSNQYYWVVKSTKHKDDPILLIRNANGNNPDSQEIEISVCYNPLFLSTKNTLDAPVTKTASQTMKVSYTITEEGSD